MFRILNTVTLLSLVYSLLQSCTINQPSVLNMIALFSPGQYVCHPKQPDWGLGQVQSAVADRVTVNFEHTGKQLIITSVVDLVSLNDREVSAYKNKNTSGS